MIEILKTDWVTSKDILKTIRAEVFIQEQKVPATLEWDHEDSDAIHLLAIDTDNSKKENAIGTGRIVIHHEQAQIGRMAILKPWRRQGIGAQLLHTALSICKQEQLQSVFIHAQEDSVPFYAQAGFQLVGERFVEAGIPHRKMQLHLT